MFLKIYGVYLALLTIQYIFNCFPLYSRNINENISELCKMFFLCHILFLGRYKLVLNMKTNKNENTHIHSVLLMNYITYMYIICGDVTLRFYNY